MTFGNLTNKTKRVFGKMSNIPREIKKQIESDLKTSGIKNKNFKIKKIKVKRIGKFGDDFF